MCRSRISRSRALGNARALHHRVDSANPAVQVLRTIQTTDGRGNGDVESSGTAISVGGERSRAPTAGVVRAYASTPLSCHFNLEHVTFLE